MFYERLKKCVISLMISAFLVMSVPLVGDSTALAQVIAVVTTAENISETDKHGDGENGNDAYKSGVRCDSSGAGIVIGS